jgi:hypothetical protein
VGMDIEELQRKVMEFRDARDCAQFQSKRSEVSASEIRDLEDLGWSSTRRNILSKKQKVAQESIT